MTVQATVKKEAAALAVEEQVREKEAVEAENAAAQAKIAENEAMVSSLRSQGLSPLFLPRTLAGRPVAPACMLP